LARITRPSGTSVVRGRGGIRQGPQAEAGVTVVEELEVGPYEATVLAASDPEALARWLRSAGYKMPEGAGEVLETYVDRGWYYVALRINTARLQADLLTALSKIDPAIATLDQAPTRLAGLVLRSADARDRRGREKLEAIQHAIAVRRSVVSGAGSGLDEAEGQGLLASVYDSAERASQRMQQSILVSAACVEGCESMHGRRLLEGAAEEFGLPGELSAEDIAGEVGRQVDRDIWAGLSYQESAFGRWHSAVRKVDPKRFKDLSAVARWYRETSALAAECRLVPPPGREEVAARMAGAWEERHGRGTHLLNILAARSALYYGTREAVQGAVDAVQDALSAGTLAPLRMEFEAGALVYPLYITSLGSGVTDIQLYLLSEHRTEAKGFATAFAGTLDGSTLAAAPKLAKLVTVGRDYLSELRAKMAVKEIKADVTFARADTDEPFREETRGAASGATTGRMPGSASGGGTRSPDHVLTVPECLLLGILAAGALIFIAGALRRLAARSR
ncbi:MAG: DUF2330 domain-containing protein, partial [Armatimonadota bacterium]